MRTDIVQAETDPGSRRCAVAAGGPSGRLGLLTAPCGLVVCLLRPWATDDLPGAWPYASRKPAQVGAHAQPVLAALHLTAKNSDLMPEREDLQFLAPMASGRSIDLDDLVGPLGGERVHGLPEP
jgi:hypothetical protein